MLLFGKPVALLTEADLLGAIGGAEESRALDFKQADYEQGKEAEFAKDVVGLANAHGGHLVIGVDEDDGIASNVVGVPSDDLDRRISTLTNLLRDVVEPRLVGVNITGIRLGSGGAVIVVEVPASWSSSAPGEQKSEPVLYEALAQHGPNER